MIRARANLAPFNRAMDKAKANMAPLAIARAKQAAGLIVDYMALHAPEDTTKFKRGAILAGREVGVGTMPMPALKASRYAGKLKSVLIRQMMWFQRAIKKLEDRERDILAGIAAKRSKRSDAYAKRQRAILAKKAKTGSRYKRSIQGIYSRNSGRTRIR